MIGCGQPMEPETKTKRGNLACRSNIVLFPLGLAGPNVGIFFPFAFWFSYLVPW